ncbi:MAG: hypothetical protein H6Q26_475 [Bacteroidetes bacterium]|uniref:hypothetical protein n=1 Tax=Chitinophaga sp. LS1 TaxID=3051176 RepID=UPI001D44F52E|nr:hypothetical protein [Chitinophaga sp. LS1]MBP1650318.1 hypothetical protein [Bacteroidota bacterium]WPV68992.1 hypothetical protein QQL36_09685 [Chitinophaga sp. LS1]
MFKSCFTSSILLLGCSIVASVSVNAQSIGRQYSLGFYQNSTDSLGYHSSQRDYSLEPSFDLPKGDTTRKQSWLYRKLFREHLLEVKDDDFTFYASILPDFQIGHSNVNGRTWLNTRGVIAGGTIGHNLTFRTEFYENQGKFASYIDEYSRKNDIVPGQGQWKAFNTNAFDFAYSSALINYKAGRHFDFQLGYDKNFIGDGYRSMLLSDASFNYPFLKIIANLGRVQYTTMWAQFVDMQYPKSSYDNGYRKKWGVFNYLDWNVSKKFSIGLFEAVIWQDSDSTGKRGFDVSYLNPIVFLRPVEFSVGSPDNALLGLNLKYAPSVNSTIYGQFILDEFVLKEMTSGSGWWANKFGGQLGFRSNSLFKVPNLNALTEVNAARPYTYSQRTTLNNYGHYNQPLAHPLGANFVEWVNIADYRYKRFFLRGQITYAKYGLDSAGINYGSNIFESYNTRAEDFGNHIGQGLKTTLTNIQGSVAYLLNPKYNLRLEASVTARQEKNDQWKKNELIFNLGLRASFRQLYYDF